MNEATLSLMSATLVILSLIVAVLTCVASIGWVRAHRETMERSDRAKDRALQVRNDQLEGKEGELDTLKSEMAFLRELESVRFAERYLDTKNGLELRLRRLEKQHEQWDRRAQELKQRLAELSLTKEQKSGELARMRADLAKTQLDARTLEEALKAVSAVGQIPVADLQGALSGLRRRQAEITGRLDQFMLDGEQKFAERERLKKELEAARGETSRLERETEIARAAGPILDGLLGVTGDMQKKLGRIEDQLDRSLRSLSGVRGRDPFAEFVEAAASASRDRSLLLGAGADNGGETVDADRIDAAEPESSAKVTRAAFAAPSGPPPSARSEGVEADQAASAASTT